MEAHNLYMEFEQEMPEDIEKNMKQVFSVYWQENR